MELRSIHYIPDSTARMFHADRVNFVRGLMGPYGSGKSTACIMELLALAKEQEPFNGVRDVRTAVIRNTYPELKSTTIKTWQEWIPDSVMKIKWDAPITGRMRQLLPDGTILNWEVYFLALDRPEDVGKLKSLDLTNAYVNEGVELPKAVKDHLTARIDRYPPKFRGGATFPCIIMDTNPDDTDGWWYNDFEVLKPVGHICYYQPPAIIEHGDYLIPNPAATYARYQNSGYEYWLRMARGKPMDWIRKFCMGQYGTVFSGKPVYPEYRDSLHYSEAPLEFYPGLPLIIGMDFGLTPAAVFHQLKPNGQLRILDELISSSMGIRQFVRNALKPHLANFYGGAQVVVYGDPAGMQRSQISDEETCLLELQSAGLFAQPAHTNSFIARREAVAGFLTGMTADGEPSFVIGPKAPTVRKAFQGGYQYARIQVAGSEERFKDEPVKNRFSHPADANQYAALMITRPAPAVESRVKPAARPVVSVKQKFV